MIEWWLQNRGPLGGTGILICHMGRCKGIRHGSLEDLGCSGKDCNSNDNFKCRLCFPDQEKLNESEFREYKQGE
jgi:hypothetical protein